MTKNICFLLISCLVLCSCINKEPRKIEFPLLEQSKNSLNVLGSPKNKTDKSMLMFSDQGAWFGYSFPDSREYYGGFSGPFLMTQDNGVWLSPSSVQLVILNKNGIVELKNQTTTSYQSHLNQTYSNQEFSLAQNLLFSSGHTAYTNSEIKNTSNNTISIEVLFKGDLGFIDGLNFQSHGNQLSITSERSDAIGHFIFPATIENLNDSIGSFETVKTKFELKPNETKNFEYIQSFIFPEYTWEKELARIESNSFNHVLEKRQLEKEQELHQLVSQLNSPYSDPIYENLLAKAQLTLQNNWRIPSGEIKYEGLFPSYHYKWFHGFWSWDSWKHAVGLSYYNTDLAKKQMKLMFEFQKEDGFIVDCVYRDNLIEEHNYRDTKPPLSAWAVAQIFEKDQDMEFVKYMYPKLKKYHEWWYNKRDHDQDGLCEYGSTDGSLIAAKWESGMDNAIRFDDSKILKNEDGAYSLDQESVDLNAYLYAEKLYLAQLAKVLELPNDKLQFTKEASILKTVIQSQFYDAQDGWFYDTTLDGKRFIKGEGSEGWTALWAKAATQEQAENVKNRMMDPNKFFTKVPFQTMSADHPKFDPLKGYWRGPNWLDQAYFGVRGLKNYGFNKEANKATIQILKGAEGLLDKGTSIRENYHPLTGEGLHAKNFSWSAAHILMLLMNE